MTTTIAKPRLPFYDFSKMYSYNAVLNFCVGGRGLGKTYGKKKKVLTDAIKKGHQFIYLRRYKDELSAARRTFFADIAQEFPHHIFRANGDEAQMAIPPEPKQNAKGEMVEVKPKWVTVGYFVTLATAQSRKSVSYHLVRTIIFDEFIIEKGLIQYLPGEVEALLQFYNTVDRNRNQTKVYLLANSVSMSNPYFNEYGIRPDQAGEWSTYANDAQFGAFIVVHFPDAADFKNEVYKTRFGRFMKDYAADYAKFAVDNQFSDAHDEFIGKKTSTHTYKWTFETPDMVFSVWKDLQTGFYFAQKKRPKGKELYYVTDRSKMAVGKTYLEPNNPLIQGLRTQYNNARIYFDEPRTRNAFVHFTRRQ